MSKIFCGHRLDRGMTKSVVSLIEMTTGKFKVHKRFFRTEETFWKAIKFITGLSRVPDEQFFQAVRRIRGTIGQYSPEKRAKMINSVDVIEFYKIIGLKISDDETIFVAPIREVVGRKPRAPRAPRQKTVARAKAPTVASKDEFYKSWEWRTLRMEVLKEHGRACQCCGAEPGMKTSSGEAVRICVDHIKPLSKFWHLRLDRTNLQVLCDECNMGKGNWDQTDFRPPVGPDEWATEIDGVDPLILQQLKIGTLQ